MARAEELTEPKAAQAFLESSKITELSNLSELDPTCFAELNGDWVIIDYGHGATARIWPIVSKVGD